MRFTPWTVAALCAVVAFACVHGAAEILLDRRRVYGMYPRSWGQW